MFNQLFKAGFLTFFLGLSSLTAVQANDQLEDTMEEMKKNFKKLTKADNTDEMKPYVIELQTLAKQAAELKPDEKGDMAPTAEDLVIYDENMEKLQAQLASLKEAVNNNDTEQAETLIKSIGKIRKESHNYFEVN